MKIKTTSRQKIDGQFCWFLVPEVILGVPKYDQGACIAYLMDKLKENGFNIRYVHPNTLFISWLHWVPSYVRTELKKKTGIVVNEYGQKIDENGNETKQLTDSSNPNEGMFNLKNTNQSVSKKDNKNYTPIKSYKPSGNLVYNDDLLNTIEDKFT